MSATPADDRTAWLRTMLEIRLFEDKVQELFMSGQIQGTTHLCQGQEAVCVGAVGALGERDYLTITYRGHGHALARGMTMESAFGELMGLTSGCCSGVDGPGGSPSTTLSKRTVSRSPPSCRQRIPLLSCTRQAHRRGRRA